MDDNQTKKSNNTKWVYNAEMKPVNGIVIVAMNEWDWYAGKNVEECISQYMNDIGEDYDALDDPHIISEEEAHSLRWLDEDDSSDSVLTFFEHLQDIVFTNKNFTCTFFASTEY